jgi:YcxB-like protein
MKTVSPLAESELKWAAFSRLIEGQTAIALVVDGIMYVLPKRAFSKEQLDGFMELLRRHVPVWDAKVRSVRLI